MPPQREIQVRHCSLDQPSVRHSDIRLISSSPAFKKKLKTFFLIFCLKNHRQEAYSLILFIDLITLEGEMSIRH